MSGIVNPMRISANLKISDDNYCLQKINENIC